MFGISVQIIVIRNPFDTLCICEPLYLLSKMCTVTEALHINYNNDLCIFIYLVLKSLVDIRVHFYDLGE